MGVRGRGTTTTMYSNKYTVVQDRVLTHAVYCGIL